MRAGILASVPRTTRRAIVPGAALLLALASIALPTGAHGLDITRAPEQLQRRVWLTRSGLPSPYVRALLQTRDGYLWVGTRATIARFDGATFTSVGPQEGPDYMSDLALHQAADGTLWSGSDRSGLLRLQGDRFVQVVAPSALAQPWVRTITSDAAGTIWVGSAGGLTEVKNGQVSFHDLGDVARDNIRGLSFDQEGRLWIASRGGLLVKQGPLVSSEGLPALQDVRVVRASVDRSIWVGARGTLAHRSPDGRWTLFTQGLEGKAVSTLAIDGDGHLWFGLNSGEIGRVNGGQLQIAPLTTSFSVGNVLSMLADREGNLWIGTERGGLHCLSDGPRVVDAPSGSDPPGGRAIIGAPDGSLWLGGRYSMIARMRQGSIEPFRRVWSGMFPPVLYGLAAGHDGDVWISYNEGSVGRYDGEKLVLLPTPPSERGRSRPVLMDRDGVLWIGGKALTRLQRERQQVVADPNLVDVMALYEGPTGTLWVGTERDLFRREGDRFTPVTVRNGPRPVAVFSILEERDGTLWVGTLRARGLFRLQQGRSVLFDRAAGLPADEIYQLLDDDDGRLWLAAAGQVAWFDKRDLAAVAAGQTRAADPVVFERNDGLDFLGISQGRPSGWRTPDGRLWFPSDKGAVMFEGKRRATVPPPVFVNELRVDGRVVPLGAAPVQLPPTPGHLEIRYGALTLSAPEKTTFRYRLEGLDADWAHVGRERMARYPRVPPGRYRFRVAARNAEGVWSDQEAVLAFAIAPPLHKTKTFFALCAAALLALGAGAYRLRMRQLAARHEAVLSERARIAREMHDTLAQSFAAVSTELECLHDEMRAGGPKTGAHLGRARELVRAGLTDARRAIWALRPAALETGDLPMALREIARQLGRSCTIEVTVAGSPRKLTEEVEQNLLRIGQEAMANAVRHARPSRIDVQLRYGGGIVALTVRDDGNGFSGPPSDGEPHQGLIGMKERAAGMGGQVVVHSGPQGTEVRVEVKA
jgi:signal transduction histidine kinase/ligand-binding sensor domain-containing protein